MRNAFLLFVAATTLPIFTSCDDEYDLSDINGDITIGGDVMFPIGETEKLELSRIIDLTDKLYVNEDGAYAISSDGRIDAAIKKVNLVNITNLKTFPSYAHLDLPAVGRDIAPEVQINTHFSTILHIDAEQNIPVEVERIDRLDVSPIQGTVTITLDAESPEALAKIKNAKISDFKFQFPEEVIFEEGIEDLDYTTNLFTTSHDYYFDNNGVITMTLDVVGLRDLPEIVDHKLVISDALDCDGVLTATAENVTSQEMEGYGIYVKFDVPDFTVERLTGIINTTINIDPEYIDLGELPDLATDPETQINFNTILLTADVENPTGVPFDAELILTAYDANDNPINEQVAINASIEKADGFYESKTTRLFITNSESLSVPAGYTKILVSNLNKLVNIVPQYIKVETSAAVDRSQVHTLVLGHDYSTGLTYDFTLPFDFGEGSKIVHREIIEDIHSDISDISDMISGAEIYATVESTMPFRVTATITPYDIAGRDMSDRLEYTETLTIDAATDDGSIQDIEFVFREKSDGALEDLDRLEIALEGDTRLSVTVLRPTQYIKVSMKAHVQGGITIKD